MPGKTMTTSVVAGWQLEAFYEMPNSKFEKWVPIFMHPRFQNVKPVTGIFAPQTREGMDKLLGEAIEAICHEAEVMGGLPYLFGDKRIKNWARERLVVRMTFVTTALVQEVNGIGEILVDG